jgi:hypothetical protein
MERELGAFAAGSDEQQQRDRRADRAADDRAREHGVVVERSVSGPDEEDTERETEVADAVDEERLLAGRGRFGLFEPEADQEVTTNADRLPKHV